MGTEDEFELDLEVIEKQGATTTALGDIYGFSVFSEDFQTKITAYNEQEQQKLKESMEKVYTGSKADQIDTAFEAVFSAESTEVVKEEQAEETSAAMGIVSGVGFTLLGAVLTAGVFYLIEKMMKRRKKSDGHKNHL